MHVDAARFKRVTQRQKFQKINCKCQWSARVVRPVGVLSLYRQGSENTTEGGKEANGWRGDTERQVKPKQRKYIVG